MPGTLDIKLYETGNGGDIRIKGNDLEAVAGFDNMPYMLMFGGNVKQSSYEVGENDEARFDWWGNELFANDVEQSNSITERRLSNVALNSEGRQFIENAVKFDLESMQKFANVSVNVAVVSDDVLNIGIKLERPGVLESKLFQFIWDATLGGIRGADDYFPPEDVVLSTDARITEDAIARIIDTGINRII